VTEISPRAQFARLLEREESSLDLAEAALVIAQEEYPALDPAPYLRRLDGYAERVTARLSGEEDPMTVVGALNQVLFEEEKYAGNREDYDDPRNSFLNEVMDRRLGIPILLSLVYLETARRARLPAFGINLPGHFLIGYPTRGQGLRLDPYDGGRLLSERDCAERVAKIFGGKMSLTPEHLQPVVPRAILVRLLTNLKNLYVESRSFAKAHGVIDKLALLTPGEWVEVRDRGLVLYQLRRYHPALDDLKIYLANAPNAADRTDILELTEIISRRLREDPSGDRP